MRFERKNCTMEIKAAVLVVASFMVLFAGSKPISESGRWYEETTPSTGPIDKGSTDNDEIFDDTTIEDWANLITEISTKFFPQTTGTPHKGTDESIGSTDSASTTEDWAFPDDGCDDEDQEVTTDPEYKTTEVIHPTSRPYPPRPHPTTETTYTESSTTGQWEYPDNGSTDDWFDQNETTYRPQWPPYHPPSPDETTWISPTTETTSTEQTTSDPWAYPDFGSTDGWGDQNETTYRPTWTTYRPDHPRPPRPHPGHGPHGPGASLLASFIDYMVFHMRRFAHHLRA